MSLQSSLPKPEAASSGDYYPLVIFPSTIGRNETGNIPSARGKIACDACGGTGLHAHFLPKGCSACGGAGDAP